MSGHDFHPLVKQLLDGDITLADLPAELRAEGEDALRLLAAVDRTDVSVPAVTWRVMAALERRRRPVLPWLLAPALALAAALILWILPAKPATPAALVTVRFVLVAPEAREVSLAGTFNQWDAHATPLVRAGPTGVCSAHAPSAGTGTDPQPDAAWRRRTLRGVTPASRPELVSPAGNRGVA